MRAWFPQWPGETVAIIASGQSANDAPIERLRGRCRVVVVNNSYLLAPWADMLYAADKRWWEVHGDAKLFQGIKVTASPEAARAYGLREIEFVDRAGEEEKSIISLGERGQIARGGNSAFQAVNIAAQTGATRQIWIGFDFCGQHWHGEHAGGLKNPRAATLQRWACTLDAQAEVLAAAGIEIINCSPVSRLSAYRKADLGEVLSEMRKVPDAPNYEAAEMFLAQAKQAHFAGDGHRARAACVMIGVALGLEQGRQALVHTSHLRGAA